jgi:hypothetical protein
MVASTTTMTASHHHRRQRSLQRISEDEDGSRNAQISLDPLQICVYPTYITLDESILQNDMRSAMKNLVSNRLQAEYGDRFEYFDFNDARDVAWYSGEEEDPVCGDLQGVLPEAASSRVGFGTLTGSMGEGPVPCTCVLYPGAVVLVAPGEADTDWLTASVMETKIAGILEAGLIRSLQNISSDNNSFENNSDETSSKTTSPAYFELKAASVSFDAAMREEDGDLVLPPEESEIPTTAPVDPAPVAFVITEAPSATPRVAGLEGSDSLPSSSQNNMEFYGIILIVGVAILLILTCCLLSYVRIRRCFRRCFCCCRNAYYYADDEEGGGPLGVHKAAHGDTATVVGEDDEDEEEGRHKSRKTVYEQHFGGGGSVATGEDAASAQTGEASEMAQYQQGELLECVSVASEWTMGTNEDANSYDRSSSCGNSTRKRVSAELLAAKETFDRDRRITLQKDMLHSEWSSTPATSGMAEAPAGRGGTFGDANTLSFAQAYQGQGEEVYLMPPKAARKGAR